MRSNSAMRRGRGSWSLRGAQTSRGGYKAASSVDMAAQAWRSCSCRTVCAATSGA